MLRCPKCNRTYTTDSQKFCTHDGGRLSLVAETPTDFNPNATVQGNFAQFKEMGSMPGPATPPAPPPGPPAAPDLNKTVMGGPIEPAEPTAKTVTDLAPTSKELPEPPADEVQPTPAAEVPAELDEIATVWSIPSLTSPDTPTPTLVDPPPVATEVHGSQSYPPEQSFATQVSAPPSEPPAAYEPMAPAAPVTPPPPMTQGSPYASAAQAAKLEAMIAAPPKKNRRLGLIFAIVAVLLLLFLGAVGVAGFLYWNNLKKNEAANNNTANANTANNNTPAPTNTSGGPTPNTNSGPPPAGLETFRNTLVSLEGPLADHYSDFSFSYPKTWVMDPDAGAKGKFVDMSLKTPDNDPAENFVVSYYESTGSLDTDRPTIDRIIAQKNASFASGMTNYQKISEGETTVNSIAGYEFRFQGKIGFKGTPDLWGRMVFLPPGTAGRTNGITLVMYATSQSADVHGPDDLGRTGGIGTILSSFKLGK